MPENIDDFNRGCALILAKLYESFPEPVYLHITKLEDGQPPQPGDAHERRLYRLRIYGATAVFLADEGYLRYNGVVLTSKGLAALNKVPSAIASDRRRSETRCSKQARICLRQAPRKPSSRRYRRCSGDEEPAGWRVRGAKLRG